MWSILLDPLPTEYKGYPIDSDFQTGIQMFQALNDPELSKAEGMGQACSLLFPSEDKPDINTAVEGVQWFLSGWYTDNREDGEKKEKAVTDYDIDQWRIYSAFRAQYGINLNTDKLHFWEFMGLLTTLDECAYTRVMDIRQRKIKPKMSAEEKEALRRAKRIYSLDTLEEGLSLEEQEAVDAFKAFLGKK